MDCLANLADMVMKLGAFNNIASISVNVPTPTLLHHYILTQIQGHQFPGSLILLKIILYKFYIKIYLEIP